MISLSLITVFIVLFIQALVPEPWKSRKPWSCSLCLTGWTVIGVLLTKWIATGVYWTSDRAEVLAAGGLALLLLALHGYLKGTLGPPPSA